MRVILYRLRLLLLLTVLFSISCIGQYEDVNKTKPPVANSPEATHASQLHTPALQEVLFINVDTVLVFRGHLAQVVNEQVNRDRVPLITQDGGETWYEFSAETINFTSIHFANVSQGWLVNVDSDLMKTTDGGVTWSSISRIKNDEGTLSLSQQMSFAGELNGWVADLTSLWHTSDGGTSWSRQEFPYVLGRCFFRGDAAWVPSRAESGQDSLIHTTQDGGESWREIELSNSAASDHSNDLIDDLAIGDLVFINDRRGWLANARSIYRTDDGGESWRQQRIPGKRIGISSLSFISESEGWAAGWKALQDRKGEYEGILLHTTNGGDTWQQVDLGIQKSSFHNSYFGDCLNRVYFGDAQSGWLVVVQQDGKDFPPPRADIYRTRDGGVNWKKVLSAKSPYID